MLVIALLVTALFVFAYHYERNGNPLSWGEAFSRLFWGASFALGYIAFSGTSTNYFVALQLGLMQYVAMLVPHAWVQNMGRWSVIQKKWPGFFLPSDWPSPWVPGSFKATLHDFLGMAGVGFFRGLVVFGVMALAAWWFGAPVTLVGCLLAWVITTLWQPTSYLVGFYVPWTMWDNPAKSATWGEFGVGIGWAAALFAAVFV
jgi:hypothetical protein